MKSSKEKYYNITKNAKPHLNVLNFINLNVSPGKAVDLGCGAGRDTIELLKNNWNVLSIDKKDTEYIIREQLSQKESENFKFKKCFFGEMNLPKVNLIVVKALFSDFELIQFNEIEKDAIIASGEKKHWHIYDVIAQKKI